MLKKLTTLCAALTCLTFSTVFADAPSYKTDAGLINLEKLPSLPMLAIDPPAPGAAKLIHLSPGELKLPPELAIQSYDLSSSYRVYHEDLPGIATMDYRPIISNQINLSFSSGWIAGTDNWTALYAPLIKAAATERKTPPETKEGEPPAVWMYLNKGESFVIDYMNRYLDYAPQAYYSFLFSPYYEAYGKDADLTKVNFEEYSSTFLFITKDKNISNTTVLTPGLGVNDNEELVLLPNSSVNLTIVDWKGVTNQSNINLIVRNNSDSPQPLAQSLAASMEEVLDPFYEQIAREKASKQASLKHNQSKTTQGSNLEVKDRGGVEIQGGSIKAGSISIQGGNVIINGATISAGKDINISSKNNLEVNQSQLSSPQVNASAGKIKEDGSLTQAGARLELTWPALTPEPVVTQMTIPRLAGFNRLATSVLEASLDPQQRFKSHPVIPFMLIEAIFSQKSLEEQRAQWSQAKSEPESFKYEIAKYVNALGTNNYLVENFEQYMRQEDVIWKTFGLGEYKIWQPNAVAVP